MQVKELIVQDNFKPNCAFIILDFLIRHGFITPDTGEVGKFNVYIEGLRGDTVVETKATLTVVRARVKCVLIYSNIENTTLCYLGHKLHALFQNGQCFVATYQQQLS